MTERIFYLTAKKYFLTERFPAYRRDLEGVGGEDVLERVFNLYRERNEGIGYMNSTISYSGFGGVSTTSQIEPECVFPQNTAHIGGSFKNNTPHMDIGVGLTLFASLRVWRTVMKSCLQHDRMLKLGKR